MDNFKKDEEDIFSPKIFSLESPISKNNQFIKSTIFNQNDNEDNTNNDKNNLNNNNQNKNNLHRRSLTINNNGNFLLNQIGYIKHDIKNEKKKQNLEEDKKTKNINSFKDITEFVNKLLYNHNNKYNFESSTKLKKIDENLEIKEKNCTEDNYKIRRKYTENSKKIKKSKIAKINNVKENKFHRRGSVKNIEFNNNFDVKISNHNKSSLSFGEVDEENNEEDSEEDNNDSSYISKIESKHVSMYDIDEELKELKEIRNDLKSPIYNPSNRNNNRLISSFSINNNENENENENNDNIKPKSILFQLEKMATQKNEYKNIVNHNPIVFDDDLELSFHEEKNKKSTKNQNASSEKVINYTNDKNYIKKLIDMNDDKLFVSKIEDIKNEKYCFYYKNDCNVIKNISVDFLINIEEIQNVRKIKYNINDYNIDIRRNSKKIRNSNINGKNKNIYKNVNTENKINKKKEIILRNKKEPYNKNKNLTKNVINKENISLKNNYYMKNTNELNKLIKEKINFLSLKNCSSVQQIQYPTTTTNKNRQENKINFTFINTSLNSQKELSFNNNNLLMIRENDIFCSGGEDTNKNNITYNRFYNGNNITMNNFYNNYKLNDSNSNICYNTEIDNENEFLYSKNNKINAIKNKLALKLKEEINKNKKYKIEINNDYKTINENYYKCSSQENLDIKYSKKNNQNHLNGFHNTYKNLFMDKSLSKCSSELINQNNSESISNSIFLLLNPIKEQKYNENRNSESKSINNKYNNKKYLSSEKHLLNKRNNINKKLIVNDNKYNSTKSKLNNPINNINLKEKKINISDKKYISKNKNLNKSNNTIHFHKEKKNTYNKNTLNNKNDFENEGSHNNSIFKNKKFTANNKSIENKSKINNINKCSSREIINYKVHKIGNNYDSNQMNIKKNKVINFRNNRIKNEKDLSRLTKNIINSRMNIDLNDNNPSSRQIESSYKIQNKNNIKNKTPINRTDEKKSYISKGKINNK